MLTVGDGTPVPTLGGLVTPKRTPSSLASQATVGTGHSAKSAMNSDNENDDSENFDAEDERALLSVDDGIVLAKKKNTKDVRNHTKFTRLQFF